MVIPASLSKLKSLFPVFVVGVSVAITIKLLTESTPLTSEILQVKAEEDILSPEYKDELVEPKEPEPQQEPEEQKDSSSSEENTESTPEEQPPEKDQPQDRSEKQEDEESKKDEQKKGDKQKPAGGRMFGSSKMAQTLKRILSAGNKK